MSPTTTRPAAAVLLTAALVLAACSGTEEERPPTLEEKVTFEEIAMPDSLVSTSRRVGPWSVVAESGNLPRLAVTTVAHGRASEADVGVWHARGTDLLAEQGEIEVAGDVASAVVASDGTLTAIAGTSVVDGVPRSFLLTSTDRSAWEPVELGADADEVAASATAVSDGHVYLLGAGPTGRTPRLAVHDVADGVTSVTPLVGPGADENLVLTGVAAIGQRVVVVAARGQKGEFTAPFAQVSDDGGQSFSSVEIGPDTFSVSGIVAAGDEIVATGSVRTSGYAKPAAWTSTDGRSWSADDISSLWEWDPRQWSSEHDDVRFSAPSYDPATGTVAAATLNDGSVAVAGSVRTDGRTWQTPVYTASQGFDPLARVTPVGSHLAVLTRFDGGSAAELVVEPYLEEVAESQVVTYEAEPNGLLVADLGEQTVVTVTTRQYVNEPDRSRMTTTSDLYAYSPDGGLVPDAWGPEGLPEESYPLVASDPDGGRSVLVTGVWSGDEFVTRSWARDEDGGWLEGAPIDAAGLLLADAVAPTGSGWLAAMDSEQDDGSTTHRRAELWQSDDGLAWARQEGTFTLPGGRNSSVASICDSPPGPLAVGWMEDSDGQRRATVWRQVDGSWGPSVLADTSGSWLDSCLAAEDGVMVFGFDGVAFGSWASTDLSTFTSVDTLAEGLSRDGVVEVPGGYAGGGTARTDDWVGPVLWLSPDAREWTWVALPLSTSSHASPVVAAAGEDLLVAHPGVLRAWRVPDIAGVLAAP